MSDKPSVLFVCVHNAGRRLGLLYLAATLTAAMLAVWAGAGATGWQPLHPRRPHRRHPCEPLCGRVA